MTARAFFDPTRAIDLRNKIDPDTGVGCIGRAWKPDPFVERWLCLADVGALCVVEVKIVADPEAPRTSDRKGTLIP